MLIVCPKCSTKYQTPETVALPVGKKVKCSACQHIFCLTDETIVEQVTETTSTATNIAPSTNLPEVPENENVFADDQVFQNEVPQPFVPVPSQEPEKKHAIGSIAAFISFIIVVILCVAGVVYKDVIFNDILMPIPPKPIRSVTEQKQPEQKPVSNNHVSPKHTPRSAREIGTPKVVFLPQIQSVRFERKDGAQPTIRIEGILKNTTQRDLMLPKTVRAMAYNSQGQILFEKDIYLTDTVLPSGEERAFFGSYQPAPEDVQWVDVTF